MPKKRILLDCTPMKYPHTGLYFYCLHLGRALIEQIDQETEELIFFIPKNIDAPFGDEQRYIYRKAIHKLFRPSTGVDVWHATYQATRFFPFRKKTSVVLTVHDLNVLHEGADHARRKKEVRRLKKKLIATDHVVAISSFTRQDLLHNTGTQVPISVIYNGCNISSRENPETPLLLPSAEFLFTIGSLNAKKNFHVLLNLLVGNDFQLFIAGETDDAAYKEKMLQLAAEADVSDRLFFTGPVTENDKQWYLQHCLAFVFPSLAEGFGLPVIEAMYFGKPVVLSNLTALPEIGGDAAFYFNSFEEDDMRTALASALKHSRRDPNVVEKIKAHAALFNWQKAAHEYLNVYRSLY